MLRIALAATATAMMIALPVSCGLSGSTYGDCADPADCQSATQYVPGTTCDDGQCTCRDPSQKICCAWHDTAANCYLGCRDCWDCADDTRGCDPVECHEDSDCAASNEMCPSTAACERGKCVQQYTVGIAVASQKRGDCRRDICDAYGNLQPTAEQDPYDDGNPCTEDYCRETYVFNEPLPDGTPCPGGTCLVGQCKECVRDTDCPSVSVVQICEPYHCIPQSCANGRRDGVETDIDCGGACNGCAVAQVCRVGSDCSQGVCNAGTCVKETAEDRVANGTETDVDCGGEFAPPCPKDARCRHDLDCESRVCFAAICHAPTCIDGVQNQGEEGRDCGGPCDFQCR
jgi:hypothetical protein